MKENAPVFRRRVLGWSMGTGLLALACVMLMGTGASQGQERVTVLGRSFVVRPAFKPAIAKALEAVRSRIAAERAQGKRIAYLSFPLNDADGGYAAIRREMAAFVKKELEELYGPNQLWVFVPALRENELPKVDEEAAGSEEHLYFWLQVLAGEQGIGDQFDFVYFPGPDDFAKFFGVKGGGRFPLIERFVDQRAAVDPDFKKLIADDPAHRREFVNFYGIHAGPAASLSSRDEWNACVQINRGRFVSSRFGAGRQLGVYFNGSPVSPPALDQGLAARWPNVAQ